MQLAHKKSCERENKFLFSNKIKLYITGDKILQAFVK